MDLEQQHQLLTQLQMKDVRAFKRFVMAFTDDLYLVAASEIRNSERAYDFTSNFLLRLYADAFDQVSVPIRVSLLNLLREALDIERLTPLV